MLAVTSFEIGLWLHIVAVVVGLGATFAESITFPVAMRLDRRHLPYVHRLQRAINSYMTSPALLVVLLTGVWIASDADYDFGAFWISASFLIVFVLGGLIGAYFIPTDRELEKMVSEEIAAAGPSGEVALSEEYQRRARFEGVLGGVAGALVVVAVFPMVVKPGA